MEDCIESGIPVLIEDVEEELDPVLDPLLEMTYSKSGRGIAVNFGNTDKATLGSFDSKLFVGTVVDNTVDPSVGFLDTEKNHASGFLPDF